LTFRFHSSLAKGEINISIQEEESKAIHSLRDALLSPDSDSKQAALALFLHRQGNWEGISRMSNLKSV